METKLTLTSDEVISILSKKVGIDKNKMKLIAFKETVGYGMNEHEVSKAKLIIEGANQTELAALMRCCND